MTQLLTVTAVLEHRSGEVTAVMGVWSLNQHYLQDHVILYVWWYWNKNRKCCL